MTKYVISYDLKATKPSPYKDFALAAEKEGLLYVWQGNDYVNRLPNTTLWGLFDNADDAKAAFDRALSAASEKLKYKISLEKRMTIESPSFSIKSDRRKTPEKKWTGKTEFETARLHQVNDPFFAY